MPSSPALAESDRVDLFFAEICANRFELIKEAVPGGTRLGVRVNPDNPSGEMALTAMQRTARSSRVELLTADVESRDESPAHLRR